MKLRTSLIIMSMMLTTGCYFQQPAPNDPAYAPVPPERMTQPKPTNGSVFQERYSMNLFETIRARNVGDIIKVQLVEKTDAQKRSQTNQRKTNETSAQNPSILGRLTQLGGGYNLGMDIETEGNFQGTGESRQNNQLQGNISVTVIDVLPNGNLKVRGEKWIKINRGQEYIRLTGVIRKYDIDESNTITSDKVANARIEYSGTGQVADSNVMGWFSRILWSSLWLL